MYYIVYKTTNQINGKFYIGTHKTKNLNDNYFGSGKLLLRAIEKYGLENFRKEILYVFDNPKEMYAKEAAIVNDDFLAENNTYNLKLGGAGGFDYINSNPEVFKNYTSEKRKNTNNWKKGLEKSKELMKDPKFRDNFRQKISECVRQWHKEKGHPWIGKKHKIESKTKIGQKNKIKQKGKLNSQYGTEWITNGIENKKIVKGSVYPEGYCKGRKL